MKTETNELKMNTKCIWWRKMLLDEFLLKRKSEIIGNQRKLEQTGKQVSANI